MKLHCPIWFDIDGTLVHTSVGKHAFRTALLEIYGWENSFENVRFAGNTDLRVLMDLAEHHAGDREAASARSREFFRRMAELLDEGLEKEKPEVIPGAHAFVAALQEREEVGLYLLTGNARECAFHKLRHVGLHAPFQEGGFGDEHDDRDVLAEQSLSRLRERFSGSGLHPGWVIGDTPRDVQAAHAVGAGAIGVASGAYTADQLLAEGADTVVKDLDQALGLLDMMFAPC